MSDEQQMGAQKAKASNLSKIQINENMASDPMKVLPKSRFSCQVLKQIIGETRANQVLQSMSMTVLPNVGGGGEKMVNISGK